MAFIERTNLIDPLSLDFMENFSDEENIELWFF